MIWKSVLNNATCDAQLHHLKTSDCNACAYHDALASPLKKALDKQQLQQYHYKGFSICFGDFMCKDQLLLPIHLTNDAVQSIFQISGDVEVDSARHDATMTINCQEHMMSYNTLGEAGVRCKGCPSIKFVEISFDPSFIIPYLPNLPIFNSFIESIKKKSAVRLSNQAASIKPAMTTVIHEIFQDQRTGALQQLFHETKVRELLLLQLECYVASSHKETVIAIPHQQKIEAAKQIIDENVLVPCSLIDLAHRVGTNECTLKKGFKELTGNTVFGYWNNLKMEEGYQKLLHTDMPIYEIAYELGFKHAQHFSAAFKKKYGLTPVEVRASATEMNAK